MFDAVRHEASDLQQRRIGMLFSSESHVCPAAQKVNTSVEGFVGNQYLSPIKPYLPLVFSHSQVHLGSSHLHFFLFQN